MKKEPKRYRETITPEKAIRYLTVLHPNQRPIVPRVIEQYAESMRNGTFLYNPGGEAISFDTEGRLTDGQHRLWACIRSGCNFDADVVRNQPEELYYVTNIGLSRKASDFVSGKYANEVAALAKSAAATKHPDGRGVYYYIRGQIGQRRYDGKPVVSILPIEMIAQDAEENGEEYVECCARGSRLYKTIKKWGRKSFVYFVWLMRWLGEDDVLDEYIDIFCDLGSTQSQIIIKFRNTMLSRATEKNARIDSGKWILSMLSMSYQMYRSGRKFSDRAISQKISKCDECLSELDEKIKNKKKGIVNDQILL